MAQGCWGVCVVNYVLEQGSLEGWRWEKWCRESAPWDLWVGYWGMGEGYGGAGP